MATVIWGKLRLTISDANEADHPQAEKETVLLHAIYDCFPPPGSHGFIERPDKASPQLISLKDSRKRHRRTPFCVMIQLPRLDLTREFGGDEW